MIKVTMDVNGTTMTYDISTMETLAKFQAQLTEEVVKNIKTEPTEEEKAKMFKDYLEEVEHDFQLRADLVEEITNNMTNIYDDIISRALADTDFDDIDEMVDAIESRNTALYDIYEIAREYA